ncbi:MAG: ATP-grasp domain-containing protein [Gammaproteobacteria bacterium]|nr:ATP-grasp domain-containing protein [Gammaproteobacteria bacterium]MBL7000846.1 ATP-grasp domain-containing protein [Gammaproteobacteria bacterium]
MVTLSSRVAKALQLAHNDPEATQLTYRKDLARIRLQQQHCNVPTFAICALENVTQQSTRYQYPVVLKPMMLSGSRGVIRADSADEFINAARQIENIIASGPYSSYEKQHFLVEQFLPGEEIALDGFVQNGKLIALALFDKPEPLNGPYFEESYYITPSRHSEQVQQAIQLEIEKCCRAYGLTHGPIHAEARITPAGVVLIEMASRTIGGQCAQLIEYALGIKLEQAIIQLMCFQSLEIRRSTNHAGVLMIPIRQKGILKRVEGLLEAQKINFIDQIEIHIQPGYELVPLPQGNSYLGFIFASAPSFAETWAALQQAQGCLKFITTESWALEPG